MGGVAGSPAEASAWRISEFGLLSIEVQLKKKRNTAFKPSHFRGNHRTDSEPCLVFCGSQHLRSPFFLSLNPQPPGRKRKTKIGCELRSRDTLAVNSGIQGGSSFLFQRKREQGIKVMGTVRLSAAPSLSASLGGGPIRPRKRFKENISLQLNTTSRLSVEVSSHERTTQFLKKKVFLMSIH